MFSTINLTREQDRLLMGDPRGTEPPIPDTPFILLGSDDITPTLSENKKILLLQNVCI